MARILSSVSFTFDDAGALASCRVQERLVAPDGEGGILSRNVEAREFDPSKDAAAMEKVLGALGGQHLRELALVKADLKDAAAQVDDLSMALAAKDAEVEALKSEAPTAGAK